MRDAAILQVFEIFFADRCSKVVLIYYRKFLIEEFVSNWQLKT